MDENQRLTLKNQYRSSIIMGAEHRSSIICGGAEHKKSTIILISVTKMSASILKIKSLNLNFMLTEVRASGVSLQRYKGLLILVHDLSILQQLASFIHKFKSY